MAYRVSVGRKAYRKEAPPPSKRLIVARTVVGQQPELSEFLNARGGVIRSLGRSALLNIMDPLHVTLFMQWGGITRGFKREHFTQQDVRKFSTDLEQYLGNIGGTGENITVKVNQKRPLDWYGKRFDRYGRPTSQVLAVNILPHPELRQERESIEAFWSERFGYTPELLGFSEHVSLCRLDTNALSPKVHKNPEFLFPRKVGIPASLALEGLMVSLGKIGEAPSIAAPAL